LILGVPTVGSSLLSNEIKCEQNLQSAPRVHSLNLLRIFLYSVFRKIKFAGARGDRGFFPPAGYNLMKREQMPAYHLGKETMQSAISDRTGVFILALPPWVIAIASAGAVASDGCGPGGDLEIT
jgi:hypothetical protein